MNHDLQVNRGAGRLEALPINRVARNKHVQQRDREARMPLPINRVARNRLLRVAGRGSRDAAGATHGANNE